MLNYLEYSGMLTWTHLDCCNSPSCALGSDYYSPLPDAPADIDVVAQGPGRNDWGQDPSDVICLVKRFACDPHLSQDWVA